MPPNFLYHGQDQWEAAVVFLYDDVVRGALFLDYAYELSITYATMVSERLLKHFDRHDFPLDSMILSTDNGSEYGDGEKRNIGYHASVQRLGVSHRFLPPAKDTRSPAEILQAESIDPRVLLLTPTDLDAMFRKTHNTCQDGSASTC